MKERNKLSHYQCCKLIVSIYNIDNVKVIKNFFIYPIINVILLFHYWKINFYFLYKKIKVDLPLQSTNDIDKIYVDIHDKCEYDWIKENKKIIKNVELEEINDFWDAIFLDNKVILCAVNEKGNEIRTIEFHWNKLINFHSLSFINSFSSNSF